MNLALIGGSQSTGSSLLRRILHRHNEIYCFDETHLFCKPALYDDWANNHAKILKPHLSGLKSAGWHHLTGLDLDIEIRSEVTEILKRSQAKDLQDLFTALGQIKQANDVSWLLDKTPANVFIAASFLKLNDQNKFILTVRNPYDVLSSLYKRGMHLIDAVAILKSSIAASVRLINHSNVMIIRYEDLVSQARSEVTKLAGFLNLDFEERMLHTDKTSDIDQTQITGWHYDESAEIQSGAIGAFDTLSDRVQEKLLIALNTIRWKGEAQSMENYLSAFDYAPKSSSNQSANHKWDLFKILSKKTLRNHQYNLFNNPLTIR